MMPDMLTHYHIHTSHSRNVLHKECKITIGNKGMWRGLYLSCADIYFRQGSSTNISLSQTQTRTHIQKEEFHIFALNKVIYLPCVDAPALLQFQGLSHIENPMQTGQHLVYSMLEWENNHLSLSNSSEQTQMKMCTQYFNSYGKYLVSKTCKHRHSPTK